MESSKNRQLPTPLSCKGSWTDLYTCRGHNVLLCSSARIILPSNEWSSAATALQLHTTHAVVVWWCRLLWVKTGDKERTYCLLTTWITQSEKRSIADHSTEGNACVNKPLSYVTSMYLYKRYKVDSPVNSVTLFKATFSDLLISRMPIPNTAIIKKAVLEIAPAAGLPWYEKYHM